MNSKRYSQLLKGLNDLIKHKSTLKIFFFGILLLDALGSIFPKYFNRQITIFLPLPLIFTIYILNTNTKNKLFLLSVVLNFFGIFYFNNAYGKYNALGIIFHALAFIIYFIILFKHYKVFPVRQILKMSGLIVFLVSVPLIIYSEGIERMFVFNEVMIYAFSVSIYMISSLLLYVNNRKIYRFLFLSLLSLLISSYFQGYNLFMKNSNFSVLFAGTFFYLTHFFICVFLLENDRRNAKVLNKKSF